MSETTNPEAGMRLAPCPFCGSNNVADRRCEHARDPSGDFDMIGCMNCGAGIIDGTPKDWNIRAAAPVAPAGSDGEACNVPPAGWKCSREKGHEGPCAARPDCVFDTVETMAQRLSKSDDPDARHAAIMLRELAGDALAARAQPPVGEVVAWLVTWTDSVEPLNRCRVQLSKKVERWLEEMKPTFTPLYAHPAEPAARDGGEADYFAARNRLLERAEREGWTLAEYAEALAAPRGMEG